MARGWRDAAENENILGFVVFRPRITCPVPAKNSWSQNQRTIRWGESYPLSLHKPFEFSV